MQAASMALGRHPRMNEMRDFGNYSAQVYLKRFGSWSEAVEAAGIEYQDPNPEPSADEIIADVERVQEKLGKRPSTLDYDRHGKYSSNAVRNKVGKWYEVLREIENEGI